MAAQFGLVTGRVTRILLIDPDGIEISLSKVIDWTRKDDISKVNSTGIDGIREILPAYNGASGSFTAELRDSDLYDFFAARKLEYQLTGNYRYSTFYGYIDYADGSSRTLQFSNVTLVMETAGEFKNEETAKMKISFEAQDCIES